MLHAYDTNDESDEGAADILPVCVGLGVDPQEEEESGSFKKDAMIVVELSTKQETVNREVSQLLQEQEKIKR